MAKKDANLTGEFTDEELIELQGLPPGLKGNPKINDEMFEQMFYKNVQGYMNLGMSRQEARAKARKQVDQAKKEMMKASK